jgi:hypothetical protein
MKLMLLLGVLAVAGCGCAKKGYFVPDGLFVHDEGRKDSAGNEMCRFDLTSAESTTSIIVYGTCPETNSGEVAIKPIGIYAIVVQP